MIKEAIGCADSIEKAKEEACKELGVETYDAQFEVLQMPEKKKLGIFGGCPAKVRAFITVSPVENAKKYLEDVISAFGIENIEIEVQNETEEGAQLILKGEDVAPLIGRRGETLDALQYLAGLVANHADGTYFRITLDTGDYRSKREKTLEGLGRKHAFNAAKRGITHSFEPMNPYERRIIHTAVQNVNGAISWSEGENAARHVVIGPDPEVKQSFRRNNRYGSSKYSSNRRSNYSRPTNPSEKAAPKVVDTVSEAVSLYGKIEYKPED